VAEKKKTIKGGSIDKKKRTTQRKTQTEQLGGGRMPGKEGHRGVGNRKTEEIWSRRDEINLCTSEKNGGGMTKVVGNCGEKISSKENDGSKGCTAKT